MTELERDKPQTGGGPLSPRLLAGIVIALVATVIVVVLVGLARDNLDTTGVATVLSTLISGIVVGSLVKGRGDGKGDPP